jgi:hypothetical protein
MKPHQIIITIIALFAVCVLAVSCTTPAQRTAYNTIWSIEQSGTTAYDGYVTLVLKGLVPTNDVPAVSLKFNQFQAASKVAADTAQAGTNALAPGSLVIELTDLTTLITSIESKK